MESNCSTGCDVTIKRCLGKAYNMEKSLCNVKRKDETKILLLLLIKGDKHFIIIIIVVENK